MNGPYNISAIAGRGVSVLIEQFEQDVYAVLPSDHILVLMIDPNDDPMVPKVFYQISPRRQQAAQQPTLPGFPSPNQPFGPLNG